MRWAKITTPLRPPGFVERRKIDALLDQHVEPSELGRVVLVSAPAGQGKTAAVAAWVRSHPQTPAVWVSLDPTDRTEQAWWDTILVALDTVAEDTETPTAADVPGRSRRSGPRASADTVLDALDGLRTRTVFVLDDVHEIVGQPAFAALLDLLRHPLPMLTIVLCSRFDPPVGLERLRMQGRLGELRAAQLTFTTPDATSLFDNHELHLTSGQVERLVERTAGWVAALRLAALTLHELPDTAAAIDDFAGDDHAVAAYLVGEVLDVLDERHARVLEAASVCSPIPVDLAVELSGCRDGAAVLDHLEAVTALVTATDRRRTYFRTHELLRSHTLARLRRRHPDRLVELYRRAGAWFVEHDEPGEALRCAAAAGDVPTVQLLVRSRAIELLGRGTFDQLADTDRTLTQAADEPRVRLVLGLTALERGDLDRGEHLIDSAERELAADEHLAHHSANLVVFRRVAAARVAFMRGRLPDALAAGATIDPDSADDVALRALALATRGTALLTSDNRRAGVDSAEALALAERHGWPYLALQAQSTLTLAHNYTGQRDQMGTHARGVIDRARAHGWSHSQWTLRAWFTLATAEVLRGRPQQALAHIDRADTACTPAHPLYEPALAALRGGAEHDAGDPLTGWQRLRRARLAHPDGDRERHELALAVLLEHRAALALGRASEAADVTRAVAARLEGTAELALLRARDQWTHRDPQARTTLEPVLAKARPVLTSLTLVEASLLAAEIALHRGEQSIAHRRLRRTLDLAARFGALRPLRHAPDPVRRHLAEHRGAFAELDPLVDEILAHDRPLPAPGNLTREHLTSRERDVLELLPTMRSADDIAQDLALSVNTVKTHQRAIYRKLGADTRRQAVVHARQVGLLLPEGPGPGLTGADPAATD